MKITSSYIDRVAAEIRRTADPDAASSDEDLLLYRIYAVLLLTKGKDVTAEDVHNAWAAWASEHESNSRNLLPFKELSLEVQRKDEPYAEVIRQVAEQMHINV
jgi:hypothetical protein